ncbi:hypothetical protein F0562_005502 [Nyssa sinensis]|uniref:Uncharacterized protein n=1 Tax=Nyssa sinensis TaxID=561372 RepID=A0A5J5AKT7_9ASTE|nr:hypothetical protein F0562_005502 [Nyssa sinensis]
MEHIVIPAFEALTRKDIEGARNLLRIAIQFLLVRAVNNVILASDEFQGLLPRDDPLLKKCIDPMDALARSSMMVEFPSCSSTTFMGTGKVIHFGHNNSKLNDYRGIWRTFHILHPKIMQYFPMINICPSF